MQDLETMSNYRELARSEVQRMLSLRDEVIRQDKEWGKPLVCRYDYRARCSIPITMTCASIDCPVWIKLFGIKDRK